VSPAVAGNSFSFTTKIQNKKPSIGSGASEISEGLLNSQSVKLDASVVTSKSTDNSVAVSDGEANLQNIWQEKMGDIERETESILNGLSSKKYPKWKCPTCQVWITREPISKQCVDCRLKR
jgi:hypothetical protein